MTTGWLAKSHIFVLRTRIDEDVFGLVEVDKLWPIGFCSQTEQKEEKIDEIVPQSSPSMFLMMVGSRSGYEYKVCLIVQWRKSCKDKYVFLLLLWLHMTSIHIRANVLAIIGTTYDRLLTIRTWFQIDNLWRTGSVLYHTQRSWWSENGSGWSFAYHQMWLCVCVSTFMVF